MLKQQVLQQQQQKKNKKGLLCINLRGKNVKIQKLVVPTTKKNITPFEMKYKQKYN